MFVQEIEPLVLSINISNLFYPIVFSGVYGPYTGSYQRESTHSQGNSSGGRAVIASKSTPHACFVGPIPRVIAHTAFPA